MDDLSVSASHDLDAAGPQEHGNRLARNALSLAGNIGIALGSAGPTASIALTLAAVVAASSFASPIAILICGLPMLAIAAAFRRLNRWRVNCGGIYAWGGRAISPYYGFAAGWIVILAYVVGVVSISLPIGPYVVSLFTSATSRPGEAIAGFIASAARVLRARVRGRGRARRRLVTGTRLTLGRKSLLVGVGLCLTFVPVVFARS